MAVKPRWHQKVAYDMTNLYLDTSSVLHCDHCHERLGALRILRAALFKKQGVTYYVSCKQCHQVSPRVKGAYKTTIKEQWDHLQQGE